MKKALLCVGSVQRMLMPLVKLPRFMSRDLAQTIFGTALRCAILRGGSYLTLTTTITVF